MIKNLPLFPDYDLSLDWDKNTIEEAKDFIKYVLTDKVPKEDRFLVGYSGGKDSTVLLQLVLEVCEELGGDYKQRLLVSSIFTRYEIDRQRIHLEKQIERIRALGVEVKVGKTIWEESYGTVTLGVGVPSLMLKFRECNQMKATPVQEATKFAKWNLSGTRSEESGKRSKEERIGKYNGNITTARPLKYLKESDVWGYLHYIKETKWGLSYKELKTHYELGGSSRDGCWCCCYHKGYDGLSPAQKRVLEKLDLIRGVTALRNGYKCKPNEVIRGLDYPGRTVDFPTLVIRGYDDLIFSVKITRNLLRPINVCKQALAIVNKIEEEENEVGKIIFPQEQILIKDIHTLRERYGIVRIKRWMLNPEFWNGRHLADLDPFTIETYSKYKPPKYILNRCKGDWFGRMARERVRLPLFKEEEERRGLPPITALSERYKESLEFAGEILHSPYNKDDSFEPWEGFYKNGDPALIIGQENLPLEKISRSWQKKAD